jgi:Fe-S oxidoreductase/FAD/FMN-containing dehydrogenase
VKTMLEQVKWALLSTFGSRVAFNDIERTLYAAEPTAWPGTAGMAGSLPDAVVQPRNAADLAALVKIGRQYKVSLVPWGAGTSPYGGAFPLTGGIVADLSRLKKVMGIDIESMTVTVEPGVVWNNLEHKLRDEGLALRLYPGGAISATVGGWIANGGGAGIGSYEYGYIRDNIAVLEIITPQGGRTLSGADIDLVYGLAGTTGFISSVTLKVRRTEDDIPLLAAFQGPDSLTAAFAAVSVAGLPLWDAGYREPRYVRLTQQSIDETAGRALSPVGEKPPRLPEGVYLARFIYPHQREAGVRDRLIGIIKTQGGEVLGDDLARYEWSERFNPLRLRALGRSMTTDTVVIPAGALPAIAGMIGALPGVVVWNGVLVSGGRETALTAYTLDAPRPPLVEAAVRLEGRAYAVGAINNAMAGQVLGADKVRRAGDFKHEVDPDGIMNPGKIFSIPREVTPAAASGNDPGREALFLKQPRGGEAVRDAFACAGCGYCRVGCPLFNAVGWESASPRGKYRFLREYLRGNLALDERMAEMFYVCTTCGRCDLSCQVGLPVGADMNRTLRPFIWKEGFRPPLLQLQSAHNILVSHNPVGKSQDTRRDWMTPDLKVREEGETAYWAGCVGSYTYAARNLPVNAVRILNRAGIEPVYLGREEWCCGGILFTVGAVDEVRSTVEHNIRELARRGVKTLIISCAGGWGNFTHLYPGLAESLHLGYEIRIRHITEVISELIDQGKIKLEKPLPLRVTYHDSCHIGRGGGIYEAPRRILRAIPGLELIEMPRNREHAACCGKHDMFYAKLAAGINFSRVEEAQQTGAEALVCACHTCENNFRTGLTELGGTLEVVDLSDLVAASLGLPLLAVSRLPKLLRRSQNAAAGGA